MTTPARSAEADAASTAFHLALLQIGVSAVEDALVLWEDVPPSARASAAASWLDNAVRLVMTRRGFSRELALAYYRLVRALHTGRTIAHPNDPKPPASVSLDLLRQEFSELAKDSQADRDPSPPGEAAGGNPGPPPANPEDEDEENQDDEDDRILLEELASIDRDIARLEKLAEEEARIVLEALGPRNQQAQVEQIGDKGDAATTDAKRDAAHASAGARQAATAARVAMDGGRSTIWAVSSTDKRCIGYVRLSRTGTPCGWCAMLISRGPVYRSEGSATFAGGAASYDDGDKYHDNCNCYAMPVFTREQYGESDLFALNRKYAEEWPRVTRGLSGKAALSAWRDFIRREQKTASAPVAEASP